jgi:methyltransferase-like protein 6
MVADNVQSIPKEDGQNGTFWQEDAWTAEDQHEAERRLKEAREYHEQCKKNQDRSSQKLFKEDDEKAWNKFYKHHKTNFFKDRHYFQKAWPNEFRPRSSSSEIQQKTLVEIGCGVGNALLPFLEDEAYEWTVYGLDLSRVAIDWLKQDERFLKAAQNHRAMAYVLDISSSATSSSAPPTSDDFSDTTCEPSLKANSILTTAESVIPKPCRQVADVTALVFCLSAIAPGEKQIQAVQNVAATLKPKTGVVVFRDYGRYDEAQMKLGTNKQQKKQIDGIDNFYIKHDGTKCYYFTLEDVRDLFENKAGLKVLELEYIRRTYKNRAKNEVRRRVWVQGRFQKVD